MPRHLISGAHEWINEIPNVPIYYLAKKSAAVLGKSANWIRNSGIRIGSEGQGVWALSWKQVGLQVGLAEP